jgi:hypothetical protein
VPFFSQHFAITVSKYTTRDRYGIGPIGRSTLRIVIDHQRLSKKAKGKAVSRDINLLPTDFLIPIDQSPIRRSLFVCLFSNHLK